MKKKWIAILVAAMVLLPVFGGASRAESDARSLSSITSKTAILLDADTGMVVFESSPDTRAPIASMTKIMTLLLVFDALEKEKIQLSDTIVVSKHAAGMGGSQALLDERGEYLVTDLVKSIIVASANDASVALAECLFGSEEAFVDEMNRHAESMGLQNTHFTNCTGLPTTEHYSTARDVAAMSRELLNKSLFFQYSTIWLDEIKHKNDRVTMLTNTNKLVRTYEGCDGVKTGSTQEAGFCVSATAKRGDTRLVAVVTGAENSDNRNKDAALLLDYGFAHYQTKLLHRTGDVVQKGIVVHSSRSGIMNAVAAGNVAHFLRKADEKTIEENVVLDSALQAPIEKGTQVGVIQVLEEGAVVSEIPLLCDRDMVKAGFLDCLTHVLRVWVGLPVH